MRRSRGTKLTLIFVLCAAAYWFYHPLSFREVFGFAVPGATSALKYHYERGQDRGIVRAWAQVEINKEQADSVCSNAGLSKETFAGLYLPPSNQVPDWWDSTWGEGISEHWRLAYPDMTPAVTYAFWRDGRLYIYKFGRTGPSKPPSTERSRWEDWKQTIVSKLRSARARLRRIVE